MWNVSVAFPNCDRRLVNPIPVGEEWEGVPGTPPYVFWRSIGLRLFKLFYLTYSPHYRLKAGIFYLLPDSFGILRSNFAWIFAKMPFSVVLEYTFSFWKFCKSFCTFELIIFQALFVFAHSLLNQGLLKNVSNVIYLYHNKKIEGWSIRTPSPPRQPVSKPDVRLNMVNNLILQ